MFSRATTTLLRRGQSALTTKTTKSVVSSQSRFMSALEDFPIAKTAWEQSCYFEMDFTIPEDVPVYEAIQKFAAYDVGCLVTLDAEGKC
jgi:hypothetical protein